MAKKRREMIGYVTSDRMDKTIVVDVERTKVHPILGKVISIHKKYKVHDEENECHVGDRVRLIETRPISKEKRWKVVEILERSRL